MRRTGNVLWAWVAAAAFLVGIVSPANGQTGGAIGSPAGWAGVCTGSGWIASAPGNAPTLPAKAHLFGHCPICSLHGALPGAAPSCDVTPQLALTFERPRLDFAAPPVAHGWQPAQPRGPPLQG